jgi:adenylate cyclase
MDTPSAYIPIDWRHALARGEELPQRMVGAALFADISGFTPLTESLALELGPRRGAEELAVHLNRVYDALIAELHRYGGSVIGFSGDAITCWLNGEDGNGRDACARATACALAMQAAMAQFANVRTHSGRVVALSMKAAVASGRVRRFRAGDPDYCLVDVLAGKTLENLAAAEQHAAPGEVVLDAAAAAALADVLAVAEWRTDAATGARFAVVSGLTARTEPVEVAVVAEKPWPALPDDALTADIKSAWLLPPVFERLQRGQGEFLAELRPAVALFLKFGGIDYDGDDDAPQKLDRFIRQAQQILARYEGSLIQLTIGDKGSYVYAAFGAPIAHEDDAVRAAAAALEFVDLVSGLDYLDEPQIGVTVGRMRTGAYGSVTRRTYGVLGDAVNLAARLMAAAPPGHILVSDEARALTGATFAWESLPNMHVKGKSRPIAVARLLGLKRRSGVVLPEPQYSLPMVGRQAELALIGDKIGLALAGQGQIVGLTAEAGLGKSRLAAEAIRLAGERGLAGYGGECQSYATHSSYLVWQSVWRGIFGLDGAQTAETQVAGLRAQLEAIDPLLNGRLPLLAPLLNLPIPDNDLTRALDAKVRKASLEALLVSVLRARAATQPLLLVLEDVHWIDALSADLVVEIGRAIANLPVLLLLVYRPPDEQRLQLPPVDQLAHFTEIELADFTPAEAERLIELKLAQFWGEETAASTSSVQAVDPARMASFQQRIIEQAAGNPFYIEELLNYLQDLGLDPADSAALAAIDLPDSLYSLVLSRIDRLSESQQITMKVASVIGRMFRAAMVWGVYPELGEFQRVQQHLDVLSHLELTPLDVPDPELVYLFKHVITQQVAYESLLFSTRAMLHEQIGAYIERVYADKLEQYVDLLAHHYAHSNNQAKQRVYFLQAADAARRAYANGAAINYYEQALPLLNGRDAIDVRLKLGKVLELTGAWDAANAQYGAALAQALEIDDQDAAAWCQTALGELLRKRNRYAEAGEWLDKARATFETAGNQSGVGQALHYSGTLAAQQGDYVLANARYNASLAIRRALGDRENEANLLNNLGIVARYLGNLDAARRYQEESLAIHEAMGNQWSIGAQLNNLGHAAIDRGEYAYARRQLERALEIWRTIGERWATANTLHNLANVARAEGQRATAGALYRDALARWQELGDRWGLAYWLEDVALHLAVGKAPARALQLVAAAESLRATINAPRPPAYAAQLEAGLAEGVQALDAAARAAAATQGQALSLEAALALAGEALEYP